MNFSDFNFDTATKNSIESLISGGKLPHAIIVECEDNEKAVQVSRFLTMYALCESEDSPCCVCKNCKNSFAGHHSDVVFAYPEKKSQIYSIEQMRDIIKDAYIKPNEAKAKVYVFEKADERLMPISQNGILKIIEEPPQPVYFIMLCKNAGSMLSTILSRCTVLKISSKAEYKEEAINSAKQIADGIISSKEYKLLKELLIINNKELANEVLLITKLLLRDGLAVISGGRAELDEELADKLSSRHTRERFLKLIEATDEAMLKLSQNTNTNLLATWLCSEYRRISWQR